MVAIRPPRLTYTAGCMTCEVSHWRAYNFIVGGLSANIALSTNPACILATYEKDQPANLDRC